MSSTSGPELSAVKRALLAVRAVESKLASLQEPIAIVGIGCRFPGGATDPESFWRLLHQGVDAIGEVPPDRWDIEALYNPDPAAPGKVATRWGGFLNDIEGFDAPFFEMSARVARNTDPQQRMLLEVSWETMEHAGLPPRDWAGRNVGVYVGIIGSDFARLLNDPAQIDPYTGVGAALSIAANRLSYFYDFHGPSLAVDTACSSSLVAVHLAVQALRSGECELALAGGVNLMLSPEITMQLSRARMMAPDGRCRTFDRAASGFVRGEGCGMVALRKLSDARKSGDRVIAVIRGSAVNQDGRSAGLTAPNGRAQVAVIRSALRQAAVDPEQITFIEAHGTGTPLGDPIEMDALRETYARKTADAAKCAIGAAKTNIGHLEAAAGIAGLIKAALSLQQRAIAPNLNFTSLNPSISLEGTGFELPLEARPWNSSNGQTRLAAVSSFGFGGTNAHVILEEAPSAPDRGSASAGEYVLRLSARTPEALRELTSRYAALVSSGAESLWDICYSSAVRRSHHACGMTFQARSRSELQQALESNAGSRGSRPVSEWRALYPAGKFVTLPGYPWQHERFELPNRAPARQTATAALSPVGTSLASLLSASLGRAVPLDPDEDLTMIGLDSIALLECLSSLERQLGVRIPLAALRGRQTTLRALSERLTAFLNRKPSLAAVADGVHLECLSSGAGVPVVLLPPIGATAPIWKHQVDYLSQNFRVLTVHYPGYGRSSSDIGDASLRNIAGWLDCALQGLGVTEPVHMIGWSIGGMVGQEFAAERKARLKSLVLVNTTSRIGLENSFGSVYNLLRDLGRDFETNFPKHKESEREHYRELALSGAGPRKHELSLHYADQALQFDGAGLFTRIDTPTLVVSGERDLLTPSDHGRRLQAAIAGAAWCEIPGAGHYVPLLAAEEFNRAIESFWAAI
jgi:3-oxoacyl-(acyl-carrier-protein) synthase/pimeloyl-ACP methyl ester carboxylesterase/aryl carrier-like protein